MLLGIGVVGWAGYVTGGAMNEPVRGYRTWQVIDEWYSDEPVLWDRFAKKPFDPESPAACLGQCEKLIEKGCVEPGPSPHEVTCTKEICGPDVDDLSYMYTAVMIQTLGTKRDWHGPLCGYYASNELRWYPIDTDRGTTAVVAEVEGYGLVREHENGWRAQYLRPVAFFADPSNIGLAERLAAKYGGEVKEWTSENRSEQGLFPATSVGTALTMAHIHAAKQRLMGNQFLPTVWGTTPYQVEKRKRSLRERAEDFVEFHPMLTGWMGGIAFQTVVSIAVRMAL